MRYVAFLRGVTPQNLKMADLRRCLEAAGLSAVRTVLASGNVAFDADAASTAAIERQLAEVVAAACGRRFGILVRRTDRLRALLDSEPFAGYDLPADAKRVITFLRRPTAATLPIQGDGVRILKAVGTEVFTAYLPSDKGPVFMGMLERAFGKDITTRTLDTVRKCALA